jgi:WS/DGAT/MGAT family acyltransferase
VQQLSGLDAAFLAMESPQVYGHVGSVCVLDPSVAPQPLTLERLTDHIASRLELVPLLGRRLVMVPFGLDQPYWVQDAAPDLSYHVREIALPEPGDDQQLAVEVARLHGRALDRARPLWEIYLITGLRGGRAAVYSKIHHAAMDGVSGDDVLAAVLDVTPEGRRLEAAIPHPLEHAPGSALLLARSAVSFLGQPAGALRLGAGLLRSGTALALAAVDRLPAVDRRRHQGVASPHAGLRAPHTPFNASISAHRRFAFADLPLTQIKQVKDRAGLTVNDVVMALCAGALRRWLQAHDALPHDPLIAAVPVSIRDSDRAESPGNHVSAALAVLPTHLGTPSERLAFAASAMRSAKSDHSAIPSNLFGDAAEFAPPIVADPAWRVSAGLRLLERVSPFNLFISNVPGPRVPLYYAGALLLAYYPLSAIADGQGLNITVLSYRDRLCVGLVACRSLVPDLEQLAAWLSAELQLMLDAV